MMYVLLNEYAARESVVSVYVVALFSLYPIRRAFVFRLLTAAIAPAIATDT